jgi:TPR repeat protein
MNAPFFSLVALGSLVGAATPAKTPSKSEVPTECTETLQHLESGEDAKQLKVDVRAIQGGCDANVLPCCRAEWRLASALGMSDDMSTEALQKLCASKDGESCRHLAEQTTKELNWESKSDAVRERVQYLARATSLGDAEGYLQLRQLFDSGCTQDAFGSSLLGCRKAKDLFDYACAGDDQGCHGVVDLFEKECKTGSSSCVMLDEMRAFGLGIRKDPARALKDLRGRCPTTNNPTLDPTTQSCLALADIAEASDPKLAANLYDEACQSANPQACVAFARHLVSGIGVHHKDGDLALSLMLDSCIDHNDLLSCLSVLHLVCADPKSSACGSTNPDAKVDPNRLKDALNQACEDHAKQICTHVHNEASGYGAAVPAWLVTFYQEQCGNSYLQACAQARAHNR